MASDNRKEKVKETLAKLRKEWPLAAAKALPKLAWLRAVCGKQYNTVVNCKEWKEISKQYDAVINDRLALKPLQVIETEIRRIETAQNTGNYTPDQIDLAIMSMYASCARNRLYLLNYNEENRRRNEKHEIEIRLLKAECALKEKELTDKNEEVQDSVEFSEIDDHKLAEMTGGANNETAP